MSLDLRPEVAAVLGAFAFGWLSRNLLHHVLDRRMHGVPSLAGQLCVELALNEDDLDLLARLLQALTSHAAWRRPGWCPPVRQAVREFLARIDTVHDPASARESERDGTTATGP